jgi:autotransporter-associated beta strand protein/T5SS/PEP-CTERM-associated repeat protein
MTQFMQGSLLGLAIITASAISATAAETAWTGGTDAAWATTSNWNPALPTAADTAVFDSAGNGNTTIDLGGDVGIGAIRFSTAAAAAYTLGQAGQSFIFDAAGTPIAVEAGVGNAQVINAGLVLAAGTSTVSTESVAGLTLGGGISAAADGTAVFNPTGSGGLVVSGGISSAAGAVSLLKEGSGTLTLSGGGSFAGDGYADPSGYLASVVFQEGTTILSGGTYDNGGTNLIVGSFTTAGAAGTDTLLQLEAGTTLEGIGQFNIGRGNGTGTVSSDVVLDGDAAISAEIAIFGFNGGDSANTPRTSLTLNDSSRLTLSGTNLILGRSAGSESSLTVNDSALVDMTYEMTGSTAGAGLTVARSGGSGTLLIDGGTVNANWVDVARGDNNQQTNVGTVTVRNGGTLTSEGDFRMGFAGNSSTQATVLIDGGTVAIGSDTERWMILGRYDTTNSTVTVTNGGRLELNGGSDIRYAQDGNAGTNVFTLADGTVTGLGTSIIDLHRGGNAGVSNTFNLDGGVLTIERIASANNSGNARFNFNGGLLRANQATANLINLGGDDQLALVRDGGARIDTNGFDVGLPERLRHSDIAGDAAIDGGLTKLGDGTLTLTGVSDYTGDTIVSGGGLAVTTAASLGSGGISLADGTSLSVAVVGGLDTQFTTSALTLASAGLAIDLAEFGNPTLAPLAVSGDVSVGGATIVDLATLSPTLGTIPLFSYGSLAGFDNLALGTLPLGMTANLVNNTSASTVDLVVTSLSLPRWSGAISGVWDVGATANWVDEVSGNPVTFADGEPVLFNDLATGTTDVLINSTVSPGRTTIANETASYSFSGSGAIAGSGGLVKQGAADATISAVNSFTGGVQIEGGRLVVSTLGNGGSAAPLGAAAADPANLVLAGGTLAYTGSTTTSDRGFTVAAAGSAIEVADATATVTLTGSTASSGGVFSKTGAGTLVLAGSSLTLPDVRLTAGTLSLAGPGPDAASQTTAVQGSLWAGSEPDQGVSLTVSNATLDIRDYLQIGRGTGTSGVTSAVSLSDAVVEVGNLQMGYDNLISGNLGTQTLSLVDSSLTNSGNTNIAYSDGSTSTVTLSGTSSFTSSSRTLIGMGTNAVGSLVVEDQASFQTGGWLAIGNSGTASVVVRDDASFTANGDFNVADLDGSTGSFEMSGNATVNALATYVGKGGGSQGTFTMDGGSFSGGNNNSFQIGSYGTGTWTQSAGTVNASGGVAMGRYQGSTGTMVINGGTFNQTATGGFLAVGREGAGTLTLAGGELNVAAADGIQVGSAGTGFGTLNLNGGVVTTSQIQGGSGTSSLSLNGGTIRAAAGANAAGFIAGLGGATIESGGVTIDTTGQDLTVSASLGGSGELTKVGGGVLTLSGQNFTSGPMTVSEGGLATTTGSFASGAIDLASGTSFGLEVVGFQGSQLTTAEFTLGGLNTLGFDLGEFGNPTLAPLNVSGVLTSGGDVTIDLASGRPQLGQFPLIQYGSRVTTAGTYTLGSLPAGVTAELVDNTAGNTIDILVTALASRQWSGLAGGLLDGTWDVGTTANWVIPPDTATTFANGDEAIFNDLAFGSTDVTISGSVIPNGVIINNEFLNYSFSGSGGIAGPGGLVKRGTGTATIASANTFTGGVQIEGGRLTVPTLGDGGAAGPLGATTADPANIVLAGGTLAFSGSTATSDRGFTVAAAGSAIEVTDAAASLTLSGATAATGGVFSKTGAGTLVLAGTALTLPETRVNSGTLSLTGPGPDPDSQTVTIQGSLWAGAVPDQGSDLTVANATLEIEDHLQVGRGTGTSGVVSTATFTNSVITNRILQLGYANNIAGSLGTQELTLVDSSLTASSYANIGYNEGSTSTVTLSGSSSLSSAGRTLIGLGAGATGSLIVEDSASFQTGGWLAIGNRGTGTLIVRDTASLTMGGDFNVADLDGSTGSLEIADEASLATGAVYVGKGTGSTGTATMSGGTLEAGAGSNFQVGASGDGTWTQTGGTVNANGWTSIARNAGSTGVMTLSGGTFNQTAGDRAFFVGEVGTGTLTVSGTGQLTIGSLNAGLTITKNVDAVGTVNLDGGRITTPLVRQSNNGTSTFNFNGGTLQAAENAQATFMGNLTAANVLAGGAVIDSNGQAITIDQPLLDGGTGGGLTKLGLGTLTLAGASTYTGPTTVSAGTLQVDGDISASATTAGPLATVSGSGTLGSLAVAVGGTVSPGAGVGTLTTTAGVTWASGGSLNWQVADATGGAGTGWDFLSIGGGLEIASSAAEPFAINLWSLSSTDPLTDGDAANFDPTQSASWTVATAAGGITGFDADGFLIRTAAANGTAGFTNSIGAGSFAMALAGNDLQLVYTPGSAPTDIVIDVPSGSQTQAEAGYPTIAAADSVTKTGLGTLVMNAANAYTGPTTVSAGTLEVAAADALAGTNVTVDTGATLAVAAGTTMRSASVIVDGGTLSAPALAVNDSTGIASLAINAGTIAGSPLVTITTGGEMALVQDARVSVAIGGLAVAETAGGGKLDLGAGQVAIASGGITATDLRADIIAGRNGGAWNGSTGITSSAAAAAGGTRAVGYVVEGDGSARVSFAAPGDTDLNGLVNVFDLVGIDASGTYGTGATAVWSQGDFNYDGRTNVFDLVGIDTAGAYGAGNYFPAGPTTANFGSVAVVPEPGTMLYLSLGAAGLAAAGWRRKRLLSRS